MVQAQAAQRPVDLPHDMVARGAPVVRTRPDLAPDLAGDHQVVPFVLHAGQGLAQYFLAPAAEVEVRAVDEVDPEIHRRFYRANAGLLVRLPGPEAPERRAETYGGHAHAVASELPVLQTPSQCL